MIGRTNAGGGGANNRNALVIVYCEAGSTVTMTKGAVTLTPTLWTGAANSSRACALFFVPPRLFDAVNAWTVSMVVSGNPAITTTVTVSTNDEYTVELYSTVWLVRDGAVNPNFEAVKAGYASSTLTEETGYLSFDVGNASNSRSTCYFTPQLDLTGFSYLVFSGQARGYYSFGEMPAFGVLDTVSESGSQASTFLQAGMLASGGGGSWTTLATNYINIASITGAHPVGVQMAGSSYEGGYPGGIRIYALYLTNEAPSI